MPRKIVVLLHQDDTRFESTRFILRLLMARWQDMGASVEVQRGIDRSIDAVLLIPHINLTIVPPDYATFMAGHPTVANRHLLDISKSRISAQLLREGDTYQGPVIVKTDRNFGGLPEKRMLGRSQPDPSTTTWANRTWLDPKSYPIYATLAEVPPAVFSNAHLIVEKFLPEVDDEGYYCLRNWSFFGDRGVSRLSRSRERIVKAANVVHREEVPVPDELHSIRAALKADWGKLDYVIRDGEVVLLDVNRTATYPGPVATERVHRMATMMAEGIKNMPFV